MRQNGGNLQKSYVSAGGSETSSVVAPQYYNLPERPAGQPVSGGLNITLAIATYFFNLAEMARY